LKVDPREARYLNLIESKIENFSNFYEKQIKTRPVLLSIVGDSSKIDKDKLSKFGEVTEVKPEQLFNR